MMGDAIGQAFAVGSVAANSRRKFAELRKSTDAMEANFVKTLVSQLQKESQKEFANMPGADIYSDMQNQVIADKISSSSHLGISDTLYKPMSKLAFEQEFGAATLKALHDKQTKP